jgi:lactonase
MTNVQVLSYAKNANRNLPLPQGEVNLQTITATPWLDVPGEELLEGTVYDKEGNLYFIACKSGNVYKVTPNEKLSVAFTLPPNSNCASIKIGRDGRLYLALLGDLISRGGIISCLPDGSDVRKIVSEDMGHVIDEIVFAEDGSFYYGVAQGYPTNPTGGVYHVSADFKTITPVATVLAFANGMALSADQHILYITEMRANRLHRLHLMDDRVSLFIRTNVAYYFTGSSGPDSASIDADDNIYVAMDHQGKVLVLDKNGIPIGLILIPGREKGEYTVSTHCAIVPNSDDMVICSADAVKQNGKLFKAKAFTKAANEYQFG